MSLLPDHLSDGEPCGFPGHVLTSVACFPRRIRLRGGAPVPSPACSGASRTNCAAYGQSGECAISICSRSLNCFPGATTSSTERSYRFVQRAGVGVSIEMPSVQALMDLSLPQFSGLTNGPRQFYPPWSVSLDLPASPAPARLETSGEEAWRCSVDQMAVSSACLNLDFLSSSSDDGSKDPANRSDLSVPLFCDSSEADASVNSDQALSGGDFPEKSVPKDKRQVVRGCVSPPGCPSGEVVRAHRTV